MNHGVKTLLMLCLGILCWVPLFSATWTVLVYMAGDNNLWQNAVEDINSMESVVLPLNLKLVVQSDLPAGTSYPGGQRRLISPDSSPQITSQLVGELGPIDSGDPQTIKNFANWGFDRYPSQRRMLVIWGHGDNWFKQDPGKWICPDDGAQSLISVSRGDLRIALSDIPHLDILLFDACSMQSLEVLAEVQDFTDYVIGSEELVPAAGFPYSEIIPLFSVYGAEEIAYRIPQRYLESYAPGGIQNPDGFEMPLTCSAIRTSDLTAFFDGFQGFAEDHRDSADWVTIAFRSELWEMNTAYCDVDIGEMLNAYSQWTEDSNPFLAACLGQLLTDWYSCVVFRGQLNIARDVGSAAIWYPWHRQYFNAWWEPYLGLQFASRRWLSWLNHGLGDAVAPDYPQVSAPSIWLGELTFWVEQPADPDDLSYEVRVSEDAHPAPVTYNFYPAYPEAGFQARIPVSSDGTVTVRCQDEDGNWSQPAEFVYNYGEQPLGLVLAPNPVRDRALASALWYLPTDATGEIRLELYNLKGQKVMSRAFNQGSAGQGNWLLSAEDDFSRLGSGVYYLKLSAGHRWVRQKLTIL